jgi:formylglycine-generating enzyme required for sulfatase activity
VTLSRGLLVRTTEEAEDAWQQLMGERVVHTDAAPGLPAVLFTFDEVATYLNLRSQEAGLEPCYELMENETNYLDEWPLLQACDGWRLPTEAEWEYFTRAGTDTQTWAGNPEITDWFDKSRDPLLDPIAYYFGPVALLFDDPSQAYDCGNSRGDREDVVAGLLSGFPACRPIPVGQLRANPWGLHDVLGNVLELVWDREGENRDYTAERDPIRPSNTSTQTWAASRTRFAFGAFYGDPASSVAYLSSYQYHDDRPNLHVGFRAVRSLPGVRLGRTVEPR